MKRRPRRRIPVLESTPREMLRRRSRDGHGLHLGVLPPVELRNSPRRNTPAFQASAYAERRDDRRVGARFGERQNGWAVQMIVMIMRQDDRIERRQRGEGSRRRMEALRAGESHRGDTIAPDRIGQNANTVD